MLVTRTLIANLPGGNQLAYLDSGPVPNSDNFTTLILIHGTHFNAYGFEHLLPLAHKHNLRLVLLQRKDYAGSSKYTDEEITLLLKNPAVFFKKEGAVLAHFIHYLVSYTDVRRPTEDRTKGGIGIMGWSMGATHAMSMFIEQSVLGQALYSAIESYMTMLVLYDPPLCAFGIQTPEDLYNPFAEPPDQIKEAFRLWVSSYFDQPSPWDRSLSKLDGRKCTERCTFASWTQAQRDEWTEDFPLRSEGIVITNELVQSYLDEMTASVLFGLDSSTRPFPLVRVTLFHAKRSPWALVIARYAIEDRRLELIRQGLGQNLRPMCFKDIEWGNHFIHSDSPEEFMEILGDCVRQR